MNLELIVKTSAVLVSAAIATALLRRAAASTRHQVWSIAVVGILFAPILIRIAPTIPIASVGVNIPIVSVQGIQVLQPPSIAPNLGPAGTVSNNFLGTIGTLGTLGTFVICCWFLLCWFLSGVSVWRGSRPAPEQWLNEARVIAERMGLRHRVDVRQLTRAGNPHVAGLMKSVVMLPASAATWTIEARQAALVHELTHIRRGDRLTLALSQLACAIYWFNPLAWYAGAALARERERACDDEVLRFGAKPSDYATLLLGLAALTPHPWAPATALSMARRSAMEGRLIAILADAARTPRRSTRWLIGAGLVVLTTAILGARAAAPAPPPQVIKARPLVRPQQLMALDDQVAVPSITRALIGALQDSDRQVREQAAMGLATTPGPDVIEPLLQALQDPEAQVREKAAIGLAFRRDPKIVDPLLAAIQDRDAQVREKAAIALGASGDARAIGALTKATKDSDPQVREKAVAGLVLLGLR